MPRNEIASCEETAYESLPIKDAATLLFFTTPSQLLSFAQEVGASCDLSDARSDQFFSENGKWI